MSLDGIWTWILERRVGVGVVMVGLILLGWGVFLWRTDNGSDKIEVLTEKETVGTQVVVDVAGAVKSPGVYHIAVGGRIGEVIDLAGGFSDDADGVWVERFLNRSAKVVDGQKIYVPRQNEQGTVLSAQGYVSLNKGSQGELEGLPGIGPVTAEKIIAGRPYQRLEELVEKKIVGVKVWEQIKDKVGL